MRKVRRGKIRKLVVLYDLYYLQLYNYFFLLTNKKDISEQMVLEVFRQVIQLRNTFRNQDRLKPWLFRIARNVYSQLKKETQYINNEPRFENYSLDNPEIENNTQIILNKLAYSVRELILLAKFLDFDYKLLAEVFNTTDSNMKNKVFLVMNEFRKVYISSIN
jgi:RNA polymerase sigma-70 factor (ECF subfamily)